MTCAHYQLSFPLEPHPQASSWVGQGNSHQAHGEGEGAVPAKPAPQLEAGESRGLALSSSELVFHLCYGVRGADFISCLIFCPSQDTKTQMTKGRSAPHRGHLPKPGHGCHSTAGHVRRYRTLKNPLTARGRVNREGGDPRCNIPRHWREEV